MLNKYCEALRIEGISPEYVEHLNGTVELFIKFVKKDLMEATTHTGY